MSMAAWESGGEPETREEAERLETERRRHRGRQTWFALSALGLLVFELTSDPAIGVAIACLKPFADGLRHALRSLRIDPDRARAWATAAFELSWGGWRTTLTALIAMLALAFATVVFESLGWWAMGADPPAVFVSALSIVVFGAVTSVLLSLVAFGLALGLGRRVWIGRAHNRVRLAILATLIVIVVPSLMGVFLVGHNLAGRPDLSRGFAVFLALTAVFGVPIMTLAVSEVLSGAIEAPFPPQLDEAPGTGDLPDNPREPGNEHPLEPDPTQVGCQ